MADGGTQRGEEWEGKGKWAYIWGWEEAQAVGVGDMHAGGTDEGWRHRWKRVETNEADANAQ